MATATDVARLADAHRDVRTLAVADLESLWASLDTSDAMEVREALEDVLPDLTDVYGDMAATVSADFYDDMRDQAEARGSFTAILAGPAAAEAVRANARWAIGPLFSSEPDPDAALGRLAGEVDRMALQPGKQTIGRSVSADPARPRYARVPQGPDPCAFCLTMASRGDAYTSEDAAGGAHFYHADCNCVPTPMWPGQSYPDGYDPDALLEQYSQARDVAGSGDLRSILSAMRQLQGIR